MSGHRGRPPGKSTKHVPGEEGVWVFIFGDLVAFAIFFLTYVWYRAGDVALYTEAQNLLNRDYGLLNTFLLLTSFHCSWRRLWLTCEGVAHTPFVS